MQYSTINLKWMNTKMLVTTAFLQCGPCRGYPYVGISQDIRSSSSHMYYYIVVLKNLVEFTGTHHHAGTYSFLWVLRNFLWTLLLWKTSCELVLKREFCKNWRTDILIMIKIYREVDHFFLKEKHTWRDKAYIWEPLIESWHWT